MESAKTTTKPFSGPLRSLAEIRVLVVGWKPHTNQFLRSILEALGRPSFIRAASTQEAIGMLREQGFELVFCTDEAEPDSPASFTHALRRDPYSRDPTLPIVIVSAGCTLKEIEILRAAGADDIMCPPMSAEAINKRFVRLLHRYRAFVACKAFVGPDRRRNGDRASFEGTDRRSAEVPVILHLPPMVNG